ncbi:MAG TPA: ABC transporter permease [Anaerolineae bacterium]|nr:ABC transporter permease [Anaerolineae bacterium]
MPILLKFIFRRLLAVPVTLLIITATLYGVLMLAPVETRAELYLPRGNSNNPNYNPELVRQQIIKEHGLDDPYPVQYVRWAGRLLQGDWGWSPGFRADILPALLARTPATAELTLYSVLLLIPLGIVGGGIAGARPHQLGDYVFRGLAFLATATPPFILALVLLGIFYAGLHWFPPGRLGITEQYLIQDSAFTSYTGLLTVDGLLNGQPRISLDALRRLVLPCITLGMVHWATLGRITRAAMLEEMTKDYVMAARGRGLRARVIVWRHVLHNAMLPALNSIGLSTASLIMGVFVIEVIFSIPGVSELIVASARGAPDTPMAMGFALYSVGLVLPVMLILDIVQALIDPRVREGVTDL